MGMSVLPSATAAPLNIEADSVTANSSAAALTGSLLLNLSIQNYPPHRCHCTDYFIMSVSVGNNDEKAKQFITQLPVAVFVHNPAADRRFGIYDYSIFDFITLNNLYLT